MTVTVTDLLAGPATGLWVGALGATEPATIDADPGVGWRDLGGTTGGLRLLTDREFFNLDVDQILMPAGAVPTSESYSVATSLAQATLENYGLTLNLPDDAVVVGAGSKTLEIGGTLPGSAPNYRALIVDGRAPEGFRRRVIVRKVLSTASVETAMEKAGQTVYPVTFTAYYVSTSIKPVKKMDEAEAA